MAEIVSPALVSEPGANVCGLCDPVGTVPSDSTRGPYTPWNPPSVDAAGEFETILGARYHVACLDHARTQGLLREVKRFQSPTEAQAAVSGDACADPVVALAASPAEWSAKAVLLGSRPACGLDAARWASIGVPLCARVPNASGFQLFPQVAPPRTLGDLIRCSSKPLRAGSLVESAESVDLAEVLPVHASELTSLLPSWCIPGGEVDVSWRVARRHFNEQRREFGAFRLRCDAPDAWTEARRAKRRVASLLACQSAEWGVLDEEAADFILREATLSHNSCFIPELAYCLRRGVPVTRHLQAEAGELLLFQPGTLRWSYARGKAAPTIRVDWSFAEASLKAFAYTLKLLKSNVNPAIADDPIVNYKEFLDPEAEIDFATKLLDQRERLGLPQDLVDGLGEFLARANAETASVLEQFFLEKHTIIRKPELSASSTRPLKCEVITCRRELVGAYALAPLSSETAEIDNLVNLTATCPLRDPSKKDRSTLPDWLRVGCRVLVNLTVSGNSNDRPPRAIGASHVPAILLKTGHGFFTVYLEGSGELVVKRRAAIEPHPKGPRVPSHVVVEIRSVTGEVDPESTRLLPRSRPMYHCLSCASKLVSSVVKPEIVAFSDALLKSEPFLASAQDDSWIEDPPLLPRMSSIPLLHEDDSVLLKLEADEELQSHQALESQDDGALDLVVPVSPDAGVDALRLAQLMGSSPYTTNHPVPPSIVDDLLGGTMVSSKILQLPAPSLPVHPGSGTISTSFTSSSSSNGSSLHQHPSSKKVRKTKDESGSDSDSLMDILSLQGESSTTSTTSSSSFASVPIPARVTKKIFLTNFPEDVTSTPNVNQSSTKKRKAQDPASGAATEETKTVILLPAKDEVGRDLAELIAKSSFFLTPSTEIVDPYTCGIRPIQKAASVPGGQSKKGSKSEYASASKSQTSTPSASVTEAPAPNEEDCVAAVWSRAEFEVPKRPAPRVFGAHFS